MSVFRRLAVLAATCLLIALGLAGCDQGGESGGETPPAEQPGQQ